ncbi:MAG: tripartite tricarboxylate transporter substrate binding protein, partial [Betaproteobacteria bacterium]|nr:tripartite tricarboxylate transporter substrate binding protein [Betaproteobacteria bacterium]
MRLATHTMLAALCGAQCHLAPALAQEYPDRPIRMLTPSLPGGAPDVGARVVAERLSVRLGQKVVVENRAGAGGVIA